MGHGVYRLPDRFSYPPLVQEHIVGDFTFVLNYHSKIFLNLIIVNTILTRSLNFIIPFCQFCSFVTEIERAPFFTLFEYLFLLKSIGMTACQSLLFLFILCLSLLYSRKLEKLYHGTFQQLFCKTIQMFCFKHFALHCFRPCLWILCN